MNCCIADLHRKEVISSKNGCRIGCVCDVEVDTCTGKLVSIIIWGKPKYMGICGRRVDVHIPWDNVEVIGEDTILVCFEPPAPPPPPPRQRGKGFEGLFR